jgi:hypothetical protein
MVGKDLATGDSLGPVPVVPTVGRIVHYYLAPPGSQGKLVTHAALVTGVDVDARGPSVSLCVFMDQATPKGHARTYYVRCAIEATSPTAFCWSWPPRTP